MLFKIAAWKFCWFQGKDQWDQILSKDTAGMANNAEDFTKQFMSQMFGKESPAPPPGLNI
jgi:hypothetical protein